MTATLTLGCNTYHLTPTTEPVKATYHCGDWYISSKDCSTIDHLTVLSKQDPSQTVIFKANVNGLKANVSTGANGDGQDCVVFEGTVTNSTVTTGGPTSTAGDFVKFERSVTLTTVNTSGRNDSITFCSSTTTGTTVNAGAGSDSIHFASSAQVGLNTVINLGVDAVADTIRVAAKSTFAGAKVVINNWDATRDVILAPSGWWGSSTAIRTQTQADAYFGAGSVTLNS